MTTDSGVEVGGAAPACRCGTLHRAWRRGVGVCLVMVAALFCFFFVSSPHRTMFSPLIHRLPEYNDFLMPFNASVPLSPSSPQSSPGSPGAVHESTGVAKGFLVHSPACSIPDLDPMHHTIKRYISKPKPIICGKPPAFTSSRGSTLYIHHDILRLHFTAFQKIYKNNLPTAKPKTKTTSTTTVQPTTTSNSPTKTTTTTTANTIARNNTTSHTPPLTTPAKTSKASPSPPPSSSPPKKKRKKRAEVKNKPENVKCCYKGIYRLEQKREKAKGSADGRWRINKTCIALSDTTTEVEEDAVLVECTIGTVVVYKNVHYFFHRKKFVSSPSSGTLGTQNSTMNPSPQGNSQSDKTTGSKVTPKDSLSAGKSSTHKSTSNDTASSQIPLTPKSTDELQRVKDAEKLNVIIMGIDSASRLNMVRQMPKTYEYLTKELGALDLKGYNKVGDNTFPNLVPILGGLTREEVNKHVCMTKSRHHDDCHWVWKDFKKNHYVTAFMEDAPWMGSFHYLRRGFIAKPTDYYGRPFMLASEKEIGGPSGNRGHYCQGDVLSLEVIQNYALEYVRAFLDTPSFGFFWSASLTHDHLNMLHLADESSFRTLQQMAKMGALNNTALFFISDHGMRWGGIRSTYIGMLEERLPYVVVYLPPWFKKKYHQASDNLLRNTHRLTSNFDVHETLLDLAYGRFADHNYVTSEPSRTKRGTSLFRNIHWNRTCAEANIPTHFCSCQDTHELTEDDPYLVPAARHFLDTLNEQLHPYPQCEQFTKIKVLSARVSVPNDVLKPKEEKSEVRTYLVQASLVPGDVAVEASLRHTKHDNAFKVIGDVSRINEYGSTSACIKHDILRKYCYCKDQANAKKIFSQQAEEQGGSEAANSKSQA